MKKTLLLVAALMAGSMAMGQTYVGELPSYGGIIPSEFSTGGHTLLFKDYKHMLNEDSYVYVYDSVIFYNSALSRVKVLTSFPDGQIEYEYEFSFWNLDGSMLPSYSYDYLTFTQTLFNNDDNIEYIVKNADGGGSIVSENGTVIWSWHPTLGDDAYLIVLKWDNQYYIRIDEEAYNEEDDTWTYSNKLYRLDRQTSSITQVAEVPFNVFPTVADRNSDITVQLGEGTNAREIVVVDAMGREVRSVPVAQGQREVKVSTQGLHAGIGFINDRKHGAAKIIVR